MQLRTLLLSASLLGGFAALNLSAAGIVGVFSIDGNISVTQNTIDWSNTNSPFVAEQANIGDNATDSFSSLDGTTITIDDLNRATEPVGTEFGPDPFISFDAASAGFPTLVINNIFPGVFGSTECMAAPAVGQTCTVDVPGGSPFSFENIQGNQGIQSEATFTLTGLTTDGGIWEGDFSANFDTPFQTVLSDLSVNGSESDTYSAEITVTAGAAPEPDAMVMLAAGLGLILLSAGSRRAFRKQNQQ